MERGVEVRLVLRAISCSLGVCAESRVFSSDTDPVDEEQHVNPELRSERGRKPHPILLPFVYHGEPNARRISSWLWSSASNLEQNSDNVSARRNHRELGQAEARI